MHEIRRSALINYFAAVVLAAGSSVVPASDVLRLPAWVPPWAVILVIGLPLMEMLWRSGLRPRLMWNDGGIAVVRPFTTAVFRWSEIAGFEEEFNRIHIVLADDSEEVWEFDNAWLWSKISKSYAARKGRNQAALTEALANGRERGETVRPPEKLPRRPAVLYLLVVPAAVFGSWLVTTL
ncbi:PH (Pleckstrin Homology) domain-containing protein [Lentzea atacamensis]|uniref:PH (Pleckstrin Homology) domain-containing protein n=2 Tax=Lentzea TaxID=165301 RepID=A0A316HYG0_9PSEU|nr:PH domain-containing protein [Lentzea atacamensis]PWK83304.1 PH (Pleckstrin Homology) domain-containing protein [Lentzea atacamensis]